MGIDSRLFHMLYMGDNLFDLLLCCTKHSPSDAPNVGEMRIKLIHHKWHSRTNKEELQQRNRLGTVSRLNHLGWGLVFRKTSNLILMRFQITHICSVRIGNLYPICETSQSNTYNQKHCYETKQRDQWRSEDTHTHTHTHMNTISPTIDIHSQALTIWNRLRRESWFSMRTDHPSSN